MDDELRASLWSLLSLCYWDTHRPRDRRIIGQTSLVADSNLRELVFAIWFHYFKRPTDTIERRWEACRAELRSYFFGCQWHEVYDLVEFVAHNGPVTTKDNFIDAVNSCLERENSAYRFVGGVICEIISAEEMTSVENALSAPEEYIGTRTHLRAALELLSDRSNPDFRNSIKESVSAVEALARMIAGDKSAKLGSILTELERRKRLHPALGRAFSSLYGYTSDAEGIRHALTEESNLTKSEARFMLVCCSAFINYAIERIRQ